jgi:2-amino-4-hydroxy-6-hydroxymethyldihydropteridine diphosphokinase
MIKQLHQIYLSLGSNLGDRTDHLRRALEELAVAGIQFDRISPIYETEPVDFKNQPWFLNQAAAANTDISPFELLDLCLDVENRLGRRRTDEKGPRSIDIDLLLYDNLILQQPTLTIPHARLHSRRFVLVPLAALAPELVHPVLNHSIRTLLDHCEDTGSVVLFR